MITPKFEIGFPIHIIMFCYISGVHREVEARIPGARGISFVDDVTWFVEGGSIEEVTSGLEICARESIEWASRNAVRFEESKTEAVLLSRKRGHGRGRRYGAIRVGDRRVHFAQEATRWLEVWLYSTLGLRESRRRLLNRARRADATVQKIVGKYGVPPASARNFQQALIHGTLLYGAELSWAGTRKEEREVQTLTNRMGRSSLGGLFRANHGPRPSADGLAFPTKTKTF